MRKKLLFLSFVFLFVIANVSFAYCKIISPTLAIPVIVKKGSSLSVTFEGKKTTTNFKIITSTEYFEKTLPINSKKFENGIWKINANISKDTPVELYDLKVICSEGSFLQKRSVKVIDDYKDTFIFIQISDTHIGHEDEKSKETFKKVIEEINLLAPEFVLITGDITHSCENAGRALMIREGKKVGPIYTDIYKDLTDEEIKQTCIKEYKTFLELLSKFRVPTYIIPGNHDMVGIYNGPCKEFYEEMIGKRYYSFDYGECHFIGLDNSNMMEAARGLYSPNYSDFKDDLDDEQLRWLEEDLKNAQDKKLKIAFFHCPIYKTECEFKKLLKENNVALGLFGHWHYDFVLSKARPMWIATTSTAQSAEMFGAYRGYRIIKIKNGEIVSHSYSDNKFSVPYNKLNYEFKPGNDGKNYKVSCFIKNELKQEFENAQIEFIMPKNAKYEIVNGKLVQEVITKNFKLLYVNTNIPAEKEMEVIVRKK